MTYVPSYLENWKKIAGECPYRASINGRVSWKFHPSPDLIDAEKVSPGGRLLLAFRTKEVCDYFVEGYLAQGVKVEDDWAVRATKPEQAAKVTAITPSFEEACASVVSARVAYEAADKVISDWNEVGKSLRRALAARRPSRRKRRRSIIMVGRNDLHSMVCRSKRDVHASSSESSGPRVGPGAMVSTAKRWHSWRRELEFQPFVTNTR